MSVALATRSMSFNSISTQNSDHQAAIFNLRIMKKTFFNSSLIFAVTVLATSGLCAQQQANTTPQVEQRLRESLRTTMLELREAENQLVVLQGSYDAMLKERNELESRLKATVKQAAAEQDAYRTQMAELQKVLDSTRLDKKQLAGSLQQWKQNAEKAADLARTTEMERARLETELAAAERIVGERESQNVELFEIAIEILDRYKNFSFGEALAAREPFVGTKRVEMQTLVQDYYDKLLDSRASKVEVVEAQ